MSTQRLYKDITDDIGKNALFAIMGRLSIRQRAVLSLRYLEGMGIGQVSYVLDMGYIRVIRHILNARIKLKLAMIISGYHDIPLKRFITAFGILTSI